MSKHWPVWIGCCRSRFYIRQIYTKTYSQRVYAYDFPRVLRNRSNHILNTLNIFPKEIYSGYLVADSSMYLLRKIEHAAK